MKIAIPSHNRVNILKEKTYQLLLSRGFTEDEIFIFTDNYDEYKDEFKNVIKSLDTITGKRNHIIEYFDEGEHIVEMDDDIDDIQTTKKEVKNESVMNLKDFFEKNFDMLFSGGMWGINSTDNNFFASGEDKYGLQLVSICATLTGYINDKSIRMTLKEKEDFERVLIYYHKKKPVLKRCGYGIKTKYWKSKGGIASDYNFDERVVIQKEAANSLVEQYPELVYITERKNGIADIKFRRKKDLMTYYNKN
tara:strand:- start:1109 stop:1858 length:750 start_codon:yes stop_codon:yes gene_type:complete